MLSVENRYPGPVPRDPPRKVVKCIQYTPQSSRDHHWKAIPLEYELYYDDIATIIQGGQPADIAEPCYVLASNTVRRQYCGKLLIDP